jgi:hypothetical protein
MGCTRYFVTFIEDFLRNVWMYLSNSNGKCLEKCKDYTSLLKEQSEHKIKAFESDNDGEFIFEQLHCLLNEHSI